MKISQPITTNLNLREAAAGEVSTVHVDQTSSMPIGAAGLPGDGDHPCIHVAGQLMMNSISNLNS